jgi:hypothetical protein
MHSAALVNLYCSLARMKHVYLYSTDCQLSRRLDQLSAVSNICFIKYARHQSYPEQYAQLIGLISWGKFRFLEVELISRP